MRRPEFTGNKLKQALRDGTLQGNKFRFIALVKDCPDDDRISVSVNNGDSWVDIATDMIASAETIDSSTGSAHPLVELELKRTKNQEYNAVITLMAQRKTPLEELDFLRNAWEVSPDLYYFFKYGRDRPPFWWARA